MTRAFTPRPHPLAPDTDEFPLIAPGVAALLTSNRYGFTRLYRRPLYRAVFAAEKLDGAARPLPFLSSYASTSAERTAQIRRTRARLAAAHVILTGRSLRSRLVRFLIAQTKGRSPIRAPPLLAFTALFVSTCSARRTTPTTNDSFLLRKRRHSSRPRHSPFPFFPFLAFALLERCRALSPFAFAFF